jgi:hypothetical protein
MRSNENVYSTWRRANNIYSTWTRANDIVTCIISIFNEKWLKMSGTINHSGLLMTDITCSIHEWLVMRFSKRILSRSSHSVLFIFSQMAILADSSSYYKLIWMECCVWSGRGHISAESFNLTRELMKYLGGRESDIKVGNKLGRVHQSQDRVFRVNKSFSFGVFFF